MGAEEKCYAGVAARISCGALPHSLWSLRIVEAANCTFYLPYSSLLLGC